MPSAAPLLVMSGPSGSSFMGEFWIWIIVAALGVLNVGTLVLVLYYTREIWRRPKKKAESETN